MENNRKSEDGDGAVGVDVANIWGSRLYENLFSILKH